jgi:hypothetical protein
LRSPVNTKTSCGSTFLGSLLTSISLFPRVNSTPFAVANLNT